MEPIALITAALLVLAVPALAAVALRRLLMPRADAIEMVALGYGGMGLAAVFIWWGAVLAGPSWQVVLGAAWLGAAVPLLPRARRRLLGKGGSGAAGAAGPHDSPALPQGTARHADGTPHRFAAAQHADGSLPGSAQADFVLLAVAGVLYALLVWLPFLTYGWQRPDGVHRMAMTDWYKHLISTTALTAADGFPPPNPFLQAVDAAPYYYGFHLVAAGVARVGAALGGIDPGELVYPALLLLTLVTAAATPFVAYTVARTIVSSRDPADLARTRDGEPAGTARAQARRAALLAALAATFLAGFDLIPLALDTAVNLAGGAAEQGGIAGLRAAIPSTHLDYWIHHDERQFNAPYLSTLWAPQHMAAALTALLALHLVLRPRQRAESGDGAVFASGWWLPALLLAALPAMSAYVALGLVIAVAGAAALECERKRCLPWRSDTCRFWLAPGLAAGGLALPVLLLLAGSSGGGGLTVRVSDAGGWSNGALFSALFGAGWLTAVFDSVAVYAVELGIIGLLAAADIRRRAGEGRLLPHQHHVVELVLALLVVLVFVRPAAGEPNNLYARPLVVAWFLLAPFAATRWACAGGSAPATGGARDTPEGDHFATPLSRSHRGQRGKGARWATAGVLLCLLANGYALLGVVLEGALFWATPSSAVEVSRWINDNTPRDAVIAVAPEEFLSGFGYWLRRPLALADERHALLFGGSRERYREVALSLQRARHGSDAAAAVAALHTAGGSFWLVARAGGDPAWAASPCFSTPFRNRDWLVAAGVAGPGCGEP
jgi:hypothetical protein